MQSRVEKLLSENSAALASIESTLRTLAWILPGRFKDAELASEGLSTGLDLVNLLQNNILSSSFTTKPSVKFIIPPSLQARYTKAWAERDSRYIWAANVLQTIKFTQLLIEMFLRRKVTARTRWLSVVALEGIKWCLRVFLLSITRRPVIFPHVPQLADQFPVSQRDHNPSSPSNESPGHLANNRVPFVAHTHKSTHVHHSAENLLSSKALAGTTLVEPAALVPPFMSLQSLLSELLYLTRPLVYVTCLALRKRKYRISPISCAISMEILSRWFRRAALTKSTLEREEYARRDREILWYLLRGEIWLQSTRPKLGHLASVIGRVPVIGILRYIIEDWMPLIDDYYYCAATIPHPLHLH